MFLATSNTFKETFSRQRHRASISTLALTFLLASPAFSAEECTSPKATLQRGFGPIGLVGESGLPRRILQHAINAWRGCESYGRGFPAFVIVGETAVKPRILLTVRFVGSSQKQRCASIRGHEITLHARARKPSGQVLSCGNLAQNLAHELGHFLGLNHASKAAHCRFDIMATIKPRNVSRRRVTAAECRAVDRQWQTPFEGAPLPLRARTDTDSR